ncbi:MAG TPA: cupin [Firmicutes bacterium]|jgi:mannose-6-phosphate isomerase-like protein (cupin superfamily)|nr:cupin [Bacillota bacterium]
MLRKNEEMTIEVRERMRGGVGEIQIKNLFQDGDLKGKTRLVAEITIPVGGSIGFHQHDQEEEIFYFVSGMGRVKDQDEWKEINIGDALVTGGGKGHSVENIGNVPLVLMAVILVY